MATIIELVPQAGAPVHVKHNGEFMGLIRSIDGAFYYDDDRYGRLTLGNVMVSEARRLIAEFVEEKAKTIDPYQDEAAEQ